MTLPSSQTLTAQTASSPAPIHVHMGALKPKSGLGGTSQTPSSHPKPSSTQASSAGPCALSRAMPTYTHTHSSKLSDSDCGPLSHRSLHWPGLLPSLPSALTRKPQGSKHGTPPSLEKPTMPCPALPRGFWPGVRLSKAHLPHPCLGGAAPPISPSHVGGCPVATHLASAHLSFPLPMGSSGREPS